MRVWDIGQEEENWKKSTIDLLVLWLMNWVVEGILMDQKLL